MRITFCGSGAGGSVNPRRGAASIHLAHGDARILVDTGPGFMERMVDSELDADAVSDVVFSHLHFDHAMGVVELFTRLIVRRGAPVTVFGPRDTDTYIEAALAFARVNATNDRTRAWLDGVSVTLTRPGDERELGGMQVRSVEVPHAPYLECLARRFEAGGRSLVYSGDTTYAPEAMVPLADGADVLVHEAYTESCLARMAEGLSESARAGLYRGVGGDTLDGGVGGPDRPRRRRADAGLDPHHVAGARLGAGRGSAAGVRRDDRARLGRTVTGNLRSFMRVRELTLMVGTGRIEAMTRFYGATLGLERVAKYRDPVFEAAGGFIRLLDHSEISGPTVEPARMQINLFVDDVSAEFARVMSADASVRVHRVPERESWGGRWRRCWIRMGILCSCWSWWRISGDRRG